MMRKRFVVYLLLGLMSLSLMQVFAEISKFQGNSDIENQVTSITEFNQELVDLFFEGKVPNTILEFTQGIRFPLCIALNGEFLALEQVEANPYYVKILKSCFVKSVGKDFLFSTDLQTWKSFSDFFTGSMGGSLYYMDEQPQVGLKLELNQR